MDIQEGKQRFIESWGKMGSDWGINRTMAQVHALLMISPEPICSDQVMEELNISRGNANMNLRALMDWGLVHKQLKPGERKEYFYAEKDMWTVVRQIIVHRKKKELEPMLKVLDEVAVVEPSCPHSQRFAETIQDIKVFSHKANQTLDALTKSDSSWFSNIFMRMVR
ncbi:MAG: transcriptional regulator [Saprospiraceae bacterium]|jgi:DNA-binding transcriptional regulator GbsR (MarR family)